MRWLGVLDLPAVTSGRQACGNHAGFGLRDLRPQDGVDVVVIDFLQLKSLGASVCFTQIKVDAAVLGLAAHGVGGCGALKTAGGE